MYPRPCHNFPKPSYSKLGKYYNRRTVVYETPKPVIQTTVPIVQFTTMYHDTPIYTDHAAIEKKSETAPTSVTVESVPDRPLEYKTSYNGQVGGNRPELASWTPSAEASITESPNEVKLCGLDGGCVQNNQLLDPKYNLREVIKQMILLEDHMFQPEKRCYDCITKHAMTIEGYLQEAITLDTTQQYNQEIQELLKSFKTIMDHALQKIHDNDMSNVDFCRCAQQLRGLRKPICQRYSRYA